MLEETFITNCIQIIKRLSYQGLIIDGINILLMFLMVLRNKQKNIILLKGKIHNLIFFSESKGSKPFRISKNKKPITFLNKVVNNNEIEPNIPKEGYVPVEIREEKQNNNILNENNNIYLINQEEILNEMEEKQKENKLKA